MRASSGWTGLQPERVDGRGVHAGGKVVADLLLHGRAVLSPSHRLRECPRGTAGSHCRAWRRRSTGLVGGDGIVLHPAAAGELVEVDAGVDGAVEAGDVERRRVGHRLDRLGCGLLCGKAKGRKEEGGGREGGQKLRRHEFSCVHHPTRKSTCKATCKPDCEGRRGGGRLIAVTKNRQWRRRNDEQSLDEVCRYGFGCGGRSFGGCCADCADYVERGSDGCSAQDSSRDRGDAGNCGAANRRLSEVDSRRAWPDRADRKHGGIFHHGEWPAGEVGARQGGYVRLPPDRAAGRDKARDEDRFSGLVGTVRIFRGRLDQRESRAAELEHAAGLPGRYERERSDVHAIDHCCLRAGSSARRSTRMAARARRRPSRR